MDKFRELLKKKIKSGKMLDDNSAKARMETIDELDDMVGSPMLDKMKGLKKVTVASSSKAGLAEGLEKAQDMMDNKSDAEKHFNMMSDKASSEGYDKDDMDDEDYMDDEDMKKEDMKEEAPEDDIASEIMALQKKMEELKAKLSK